MESKAKMFGHPVHPMLIVFPIGLFVMAVVCDIIYLIGGNEIFATVAFYDISGGILGGLVAAIFGLRDYLAIPTGTRAKRLGLFHGFGNLVVVLLFALSWLVRMQMAFYAPPVLALIFSFVGIIIATMTAWLGGELVDRLGVGVDPGANLNAPSSLTGAAPAPQRMPGMPVAGVPVTGEREDEDIDEP